MELDWEIDYGSLTENVELVNRYESVKESLIEVQGNLNELLPMRKHYDKMTLPQKIDFDIFLSYAMNSLQWVHLRILGIDPNTHPIKEELSRTKMAMLKWQEVKDKSKRPTVDIRAAKRFIKSGLYDRYAGVGQPMNKKQKFNDDD